MSSVISYLRDDAPASCETRIFTFGVILIAIGGTLASATLAIAYMLALGVLSGGQFGDLPSENSALAVLLPVMLLSAGAVACIWTGIGSVRLRRWCRPIVMCLSALVACEAVLWLLNLALQRYFLPDAAPALVRRPPPGGPPAGLAGPTPEYAAVVIATFALLSIVLPTIFFFAYRSRSVERTLDEADANLYWTDRCDMLTLAFALLMLQGAFALLLTLPIVLTSPSTLLLGHAIAPLPTALLILLGASLCIIAARLVHAQRRVGPWHAMIILVTVGAAVTTNPHAEAPVPPGQRYNTYGPTPEDLALSTILTVAVFAIPTIFFALWVLRLLQPPPQPRKPAKALPRAIVLDMPVPPLPLEPPPRLAEQFLRDEPSPPIIESHPILR